MVGTRDTTFNPKGNVKLSEAVYNGGGLLVKSHEWYDGNVDDTEITYNASLLPEKMVRKVDDHTITLELTTNVTAGDEKMTMEYDFPGDSNPFEDLLTGLWALLG